MNVYGLVLVGLLSFMASASSEQWPSSCVPEDERSTALIDERLTIFDDDLHRVVVEEKINRLHKTSTITNTGSTVKLTPHHKVLLRGGGLRNKNYVVASAKFTWGQDDQIGTEQQIDDKPNPLQLRIYVYDSAKYEDFKSAAGQDGGIVALNILYTVSEEDNVDIRKIVGGLASVDSPGENGTIPLVRLASLLPADTNNFFRYEGSVCGTGVTQIVFKETNFVSAEQLAAFRALNTTGTDRLRARESLRDRVVYRSYLLRSETSQIEYVSDELAPAEGGAGVVTAKSAVVCLCMCLLAAVNMHVH